MPLSNTSGSDPRYFDVVICTLTAYLIPIGIQQPYYHAVVYIILLLAGILSISLSTYPLDNQMQETLLGLGFLLSGSFLLVLFDRIPSLSSSSASSSLERVWQLWALYYGPLYCLYMPFLGGVRTVTIPLSFFCGVLIGIGRICYKGPKYTIAAMTYLSAGLLFGFGVRYLLRVWGYANTALCDIATVLSVCLAWLMAVFRHRYCQLQQEKGEEEVPSLAEKCTNNENQNNNLDNESPEGDNHNEQQQHIGSLLREKCNLSQFRSKPPCGKCYSVMNWALWIVLCVGSLSLAVINIGAGSERRGIDHYFPIAEENIYKHMNDGPVCAMNDARQRENATIDTFTNSEAARAANYSIVHCGACGACSNWENLQVEYVTRNYLANAARKCATKSFTSGGFDAVKDCMEEPTIGFTGTCARCWARDVMCTKKHCTFIFLQTVLINKMTNYSVGENVNTGANCEEAFCEMENSPGSGEIGFVECSGATRRRMNITSTIPRPIEQQCTVVDLDWDDVFQGESDIARPTARVSLLLLLLCLVWFLP